MLRKKKKVLCYEKNIVCVYDGGGGVNLVNLWKLV